MFHLFSFNHPKVLQPASGLKVALGVVQDNNEIDIGGFHGVVPGIRADQGNREDVGLGSCPSFHRFDERFDIFAR
jgi:hypothetical protein